MANLAKLDQTIAELEEQARIFKTHGRVLEKLDDVNKKVGQSYAQIELGIASSKEIEESLKKTLDAFQNQATKSLDDHATSLVRFQHQIEVTKEELNSAVQAIIEGHRSAIESIRAEVSSTLAGIDETIKLLANAHEQKFQRLEELTTIWLKAIDGRLAELITANEQNIETLVAANRRFHREFEETVTSRIERFSSDIQVTIRQERTQMQDAITSNASAHFSRIDENIKSQTQAAAAQTSNLRIIVIVGFLITIGTFLGAMFLGGR